MTKQSIVDLSSRVVGVFLIVIGFAFFTLLAFVLMSGDLDPSKAGLKVGLFFVCVGTGLIWIGSRFLKREPDQSEDQRTR
jgi:hypothetical protein